MVYLVCIVFFFALGFCLGWMYVKATSHTLDDYNQMYSHLTCQIISRMQQAMRSLRMEQEDIDRVIERMGCKIMPTSVLTPPPTPPERPMAENRLQSEPRVPGIEPRFAVGDYIRPKIDNRTNVQRIESIDLDSCSYLFSSGQGLLFEFQNEWESFTVRRNSL